MVLCHKNIAINKIDNGKQLTWCGSAITLSTSNFLPLQQQVRGKDKTCDCEIYERVQEKFCYKKGKFSIYFWFEWGGGEQIKRILKNISLQILLGYFWMGLMLKENRVLIKIERVPRNNKNQLVCGRLNTFEIYVYLGILTTSSVTQEIDQPYRIFKTIFLCNLKNVALGCLEFWKSVNFPPYLVGLFVFFADRIKWPVLTDSKMYSMINDSFSQEKCSAGWKSVWVVPPTLACLNNPMVSVSLVIQTRRIRCSSLWLR